MTSYTIPFITGLLGAYFAFRTISHLREALEFISLDQDSQTNHFLSEDNVALEDLGELARSENQSISSSALQIIFDRAMSEKHLSFILQCLESDDITNRINGTKAIHQLCQNRTVYFIVDGNKSILVKNKVLKKLARNLEISHPALNRFTLSTIHLLISDHEKRKIKICSYNIVPKLKMYLENFEPEKFSDLKYSCIMLIYQFSMVDATVKYLIEHKIVLTMLSAARLTFSNPSIQQICIHTIVRIMSCMEGDPSALLKEMAQLKAIGLLSASLRSNDIELGSWSIFLLHEFINNKVCTEEISKIKGLVTVLTSFIKGNEHVTTRVIFRMLKCLCDFNETLHKEIIKGNFLSKLFSQLSSFEDQTQYWALSLIHLIVQKTDDQRVFFDQKGFETILSVSKSSFIHNSIYIVDIIAILSANPDNIPFLDKYLQLNDIFLGFLHHSNLELQQSSVSVLNNLLAVSDIIRNDARSKGSLKRLSSIFLNSETHFSVRENICKAIVCLIHDDVETRLEGFIEVMLPGAHELFSQAISCISEIETKRNISTKKSPSSTSTNVIPTMSPFAPMQSAFPEIASPLSKQPIDEQLLMWKTTMEGLSILFDKSLLNIGPSSLNLEYEALFSDLYEDLIASFLNSFILIAVPTEGFLDDDIKVDTALGGLSLMAALLELQLFRDIFFNLEFLNALIPLFYKRNDLLTRKAMVVLEKCYRVGYPRKSIISEPQQFFEVYKSMAENRDEDMWPYFYSFVSKICDWTLEPETPDYVHISLEKSSKKLDIFPFSFQICNQSWEFTTAFASHGVSTSGKYAYEFQLKTCGIIQIGWSILDVSINERGGFGIGDNSQSFAFDGTRKRLWNGRSVERKTYGNFWSPHDVVTCMLDLDSCTISFALNGENLGVAFDCIDPNLTWFPAISITCDQHGHFRFGGSTDKLIFCPPEYQPIPYTNDEVFFSCPSLLEISNSSSNSFMDALNEDEPTVNTVSENIWARNFGFYYEMRIGIGQRNSLLQWGYFSPNGDLYFAAYNKAKCDLFFLQATDRFLDYDIKHIVDNFNMEEYPWINQQGNLKIFGKMRIKIGNGDVLGAGVLTSDNAGIFFTIQGQILETMIPIIDTNMLPFIRNIAKYTFNFGQFDYKAQQANECFSPTKFLSA